jgi:hypothetical protein
MNLLLEQNFNLTKYREIKFNLKFLYPSDRLESSDNRTFWYLAES